jgi:hypothetical protein
MTYGWFRERRNVEWRRRLLIVFTACSSWWQFEDQWKRDTGERNTTPSLVALNRMAVINLMNRLLFAVCVGIVYQAGRIWILVYVHLFNGARGGVVVKALRYKPAGRGFDSRWCLWNFSVT